MNDLSGTYGVVVADEIELVNWDDAHSEQVPTPPVPERIRHGISTRTLPAPHAMDGSDPP